MLFREPEHTNCGYAAGGRAAIEAGRNNGEASFVANRAAKPHQLKF